MSTRRNTLSNIKIHKLLEVRELNDSSYVLRIEKGEMEFAPGQYISIGKKDSIDKRDYSIYSSANDNYLEVLIREVSDGHVSKTLRKLKPGDELEVEGPFGFFRIKQDDRVGKKHLFIASGTGISPFHSMVKTSPDLDYNIIHGIRRGEDAYEINEYDRKKIVLCTSRDGKGDFYGHVTDYIRLNPVSSDTLCYLCGNADMINDVFDILEEQGVPSGNMHAEVYF